MSSDQASRGLDKLWAMVERQQLEAEDQRAEVQRLRAETGRLRALLAERADASGGSPGAETPTEGNSRPNGDRLRRARRRTSRRGMLKAALTATVATMGAGMLMEHQTDSALASATETKSASGQGNVAIEGNGTNSALGLVGASGGTTDLTTWPSTGVLGYSHGAGGTGVAGYAAGTGSAWGVYGQSLDSYGVYGLSGASYGVIGLGSGNSVVGTFTLSGGPYPTAAVVGDGGTTGRGVYGASDTDAGVSGRGGAGGTGIFGHTSDGTGYGVHGHVSAGGTGVQGESDTAGTGVYGLSRGGVGVFGTDVSSSSTGVGVWGFQSGAGVGVYAVSAAGLGGYFQGGLAPLRLLPSGTAGAPTSGNHSQGEVYVDSAGVFWVCVIGNGTDAGTWKSLSSVVPIPNVRVMNTRPGKQIGPYLGPIANNTLLTLTLAGTNGIPSNATGVMGNLTAADATAGCFLALVPHGANHIGVSSVNFPALAQGSGVANAFTVGLSSDGKIDIYTGNCSSYTANIIIDITSYII